MSYWPKKRVAAPIPERSFIIDRVNVSDVIHAILARLTSDELAEWKPLRVRGQRVVARVENGDGRRFVHLLVPLGEHRAGQPPPVRHFRLNLQSAVVQELATVPDLATAWSVVESLTAAGTTR